MKSTLAPNWRYVLARAHLSPPMPEGRLKSELMRALTWQIGVEGMQETQVSVVSFDAKSGSLVLRALRGQERRLIASLALITRAGEQPVRIECLRVCGTLRSLHAPEKGKKS